MPYKSFEDINPALKGIKPKITLAQANLIAKWADAMEKAQDGPESAWAVAIAQFKKLYRVEGGKWVKKKQKESAMEYKAYTMSTNNVLISVNAIEVDGEAVPVGELVAAYVGQQTEDNSVMSGSEKDKEGNLKTHQEEAEQVDIGKVRDLLQEALAMLDAPAEMEEVQLSESAVGHAVALTEGQPTYSNPRAPLLMDVALIKPGFGNKKDKHYYSRQVLKRDANVFEGVKMYTTDHRPDEKSVRTEVAVIRKCPVRFTGEGAPVAEVAVHDGDFAEQARNRAKLDTLNTLECSILAMGRVKEGNIDGEEAKIVEAITKGQSVDWVTKAGAGGHALNLAEKDGGETMSEQEKKEDEKVEETSQEEARTEEVVLAEKQEKAQEEQAPQKLAEAEVAGLLSGSNLPSASKKRLAGAEYEDESALRQAILAEVEYVKALTGSGQPFGQGASQAQPDAKPLSERLDDVDRRHGLQVPERQEV